MERVTGMLFSTIEDSTPQPVPDEWTEFEMCQAMRCMPDDLDALDDDTYQNWVGFMRIKQKSGRL